MKSAIPDTIGPAALQRAGIRLLALDLDGTLLTEDKRVTGPTAAALREAEKAGLELVIVTGRPLSGLPEALGRALPGLRWVISSNGAVTTDLHSARTVRTAFLDAETAKGVVSLPAERGLIYAAFIDGVGYCDPETLERQIAAKRGTPMEAYLRASRRSVADIGARIEASPGVENIWIVATDRPERDALDSLIRRRWNVRSVLTGERDIEVGALGADKGLALTALAETLGLRRGQLLAIGDNENDLGMFRAAGVSVAMGNAQENVRREADYVTGSNDADGAAAVISLAAEAAEGRR